MRWFYTRLYVLLLPWMFIRLYWRGRKNPGYRLHWCERLGLSKLKLTACIWIHAVSLGETIAAEPLIKRLLLEYPDDNIVITSLTPTGRARASKFNHPRVFYCYLPYDLPLLLKGFLQRTNPKLLIIMETELWPNLLATCQQLSIPVILANARLSVQSARAYHWIRKLTAEMLGNFTRVVAQTAIEGKRFLQLGLAREKLNISGSIKFDLTLPENLVEQAAIMRQQWCNRPTWIAASTHAGEEEQILAAHRQLLNDLPNVLLILVPRHPERFATVKVLCQSQGFSVINRSSKEPVLDSTQVYLGDTIGELLNYYAAVDLAFIGGSLVATGGHNPLEPAALGIPIVTGPHTFNFAEITRMLITAGAELQIQDNSILAQTILKLLKDPALRQQMGSKAAQVVDDNKGALHKLCQILSQYL